MLSGRSTPTPDGCLIPWGRTGHADSGSSFHLIRSRILRANGGVQPERDFPAMGWDAVSCASSSSVLEWKEVHSGAILVHRDESTGCKGSGVSHESIHDDVTAVFRRWVLSSHLHHVG
jgi:hypothetical protein